MGTETALNLIDRSTGAITSFSENYSDPEGLSEERVWRIYEDRTGGLWIGCGSFGCLEKVKTEPEAFRHYGVATDADGDAEWEDAFAVSPLRDGTVLVGTDAGVFMLDRERVQIQPYAVGSVDLPNIEVETIYQDQRGVIWVGGYDGLFSFDPISGQVNDYFGQIADPEKSFDYIWMITEGVDDAIWMGATSGLFRFDRDELRFIQEAQNVTTGSAFSSDVRSMLYDEEGMLWLGTWRDIYRLDLQENKVTHITTVDQANAFHREPSGTLWAATDGGLVRIDPESGSSQTYLRQDGLPSNAIRDILAPSSDFLWLATLNGISRFDPARETFQNFDARDGLGSVAFNDGAVDQQGRLFFAGLNGVAEYIGGQSTRNEVPPEVRITNVSASGQLLEVNQASLETPIRLNHDENDISISFIGLHYEDPLRNQYLTKLDPQDETWVDPGRDRQVRYTNLDPGEYVFQVRAANSDGVWNEEGTSIQISVLSPWWRTWWAYGLYALIFVAGVFAVDRFQRRRLIAKEREKARERELEQAREIEKAYQNLETAHSKLEAAHENLKAAQDQLVQQEKLASLGQLTAGIAHEIKNPLNFVNNFSDLSIEMIEEARAELRAVSDNLSAKDREKVDQTLEILNEIEPNLKKIHEHGTRADGIVKSMLQHSRGGSGKMEPTDVNALIKEYANLAFHGMRAGKNPINVDIELDLDENVGEVEMIAEDFSRVILNLCNNAFDAMREKALSPSPLSPGERGWGEGEYSPKLTVRTKKKDDTVTIEIQDNGSGIPEEIKDKIMQPFFTTKKGTAGTGLGLSITNDIIKAHGGTLNIKTKEGSGSVFVISLPAA